ncbi:MAG: hypothetical protein ACW9XA_07765 [Candidatus Nitrosopumilus sp. bin_6a]
MTVSKNRIKQAQELSKKSPAFKNFMRGLTNEHTLSDYAKYNFDFMQFHGLGYDFDGLVKNEPKTISKMITDYLDSCLERGVKNATLRSYLMGIELMLGHTSIALDEAYLRPTREVLFSEYKKGINALTLF